MLPTATSLITGRLLASGQQHMVCLNTWSASRHALLQVYSNMSPASSVQQDVVCFSSALQILSSVLSSSASAGRGCGGGVGRQGRGVGREETLRGTGPRENAHTRREKGREKVHVQGRGQMVCVRAWLSVSRALSDGDHAVQSHALLLQGERPRRGPTTSPTDPVGQS